VTRVEVKNGDRLVDLYRQFQAGKVRFLLAFRHPSPRDPLFLCQLMWNFLPRSARDAGVDLAEPTHFHFIYDRGIPLWMGQGIGWLFSKLGGTPIHRGKADLVGLRSARQLFANGLFPMAAAPEGHTNQHNEIISPLEPGIAQLGFWCAEDLQRAGRNETVVILPLGIRYYYLSPPWDGIDRLLASLEAQTGAAIDKGEGNPEAILYRRLYGVGCQLLLVMERFYQQFYKKSLGDKQGKEPPDTNEELRDRLQVLVNAALEVAEEYFGLRGKGDLQERCLRIEQAGWERIFRQELEEPGKLSELERGLADRVAEEADLRMWHMRLVESFVAMTGHYVRENPSVERFADTVLLLQKAVARIEGTGKFADAQLGPQRVVLTLGEPLCVSDRLAEYSANRRGARQAVTDLTRDLKQALEATIA